MSLKKVASKSKNTRGEEEFMKAKLMIWSFFISGTYWTNIGPMLLLQSEASYPSARSTFTAPAKYAAKHVHFR